MFRSPDKSEADNDSMKSAGRVQTLSAPSCLERAKTIVCLMMAFGVSVATVSSAQACNSEPGAEYDDIHTPETLVALATVTSFERSAGSDRICDSVRYQLLEVLRGTPSGALDISFCYAASKEEIERFSPEPLEDEIEIFGFAVGYTVLIGVTTKPPLQGMKMVAQRPGSYRFSAPSCWGPMLRSLGRVSEQERPGLINEFKKSFDNKQ